MTPQEFRAILKEFDDAPEDQEWDEGHPIFLLAEENDMLKAAVIALQSELASARLDLGLMEVSRHQLRATLTSCEAALNERDSKLASAMRLIDKDTVALASAESVVDAAALFVVSGGNFQLSYELEEALSTHKAKKEG